jgi:hypothetical protein
MERARNLERDKLTQEETCLIAPCGIYCGACDIMLGKSMSLAKEMYGIINGFNIADVGPFFLGVPQERVTDFLEILDKWSKGDKCPGCRGGGGNPACPVKVCAHEKGFLTCAECDRMPCGQGAESGNWMQEAGAFLEMITRRYAGWNIENLERVREVGYRRFIDEMQAKVRDGFMTGDVISSEMVFTEAIKRVQEQGKT